VVLQDIQRLTGGLHGGGAPKAPLVEVDEPHDLLATGSGSCVNRILKHVDEVPNLLVVVLGVLQRRKEAGLETDHRFLISLPTVSTT
jgi:hypothetical protein